MTAYILEHYDEVNYIVDCNITYKKTGKYYNNDKSGKHVIKAFQVFKLLNNNIGKLISPMPLTEEIMHTQFYDKVDDYKTLGCTKNSYKQEGFKDTVNDLYKLFVDFETKTSESKHMPYLCWIYNDDTQQECIGINTCAIDMVNALPTDKHQIILVAFSSDYDCIFALYY